MIIAMAADAAGMSHAGTRARRRRSDRTGVDVGAIVLVAETESVQQPTHEVKCAVVELRGARNQSR
jgi:hypothetical protein